MRRKRKGKRSDVLECYNWRFNVYSTVCSTLTIQFGDISYPLYARSFDSSTLLQWS